MLPNLQYIFTLPDELKYDYDAPLKEHLTTEPYRTNIFQQSTEAVRMAMQEGKDKCEYLYRHR